MVGRRHYERNPVPSSDPLLNDRTARLIGQKVTVVEAIENGEGRVRVGDSVWAARGPDAGRQPDGGDRRRRHLPQGRPRAGAAAGRCCRRAAVFHHFVTSLSRPSMRGQA